MPTMCSQPTYLMTSGQPLFFPRVQPEDDPGFLPVLTLGIVSEGREWWEGPGTCREDGPGHSLFKRPGIWSSGLMMLSQAASVHFTEEESETQGDVGSFQLHKQVPKPPLFVMGP